MEGARKQTKVIDMKKKPDKSLVLVGVVNRQKDLEIAKKRHWYRIPLRHAPKRVPGYLAFYQTLAFVKDGKAIRYYAPVRSYSVVKRFKLLPDEKEHPRAREYYYKFRLSKLRRTRRVIHNDSRRRISFGFTSLAKLRKSERICQLFDIVPLEDIVRQALQERGIKAVHEHCVMERRHCRYRLDFVIFCKRGKIALECDNEKWHSTPQRRLMDRERDRYLRRHRWIVLRLSGREIQSDLDGCLQKIEKAIDGLGGTL